jgi:hypothetical protein
MRRWLAALILLSGLVVPLEPIQARVRIAWHHA